MEYDEATLVKMWKRGLCNADSLIELKEEFKKLNQYWVDKYIELTTKMTVAIGVRNVKIKEQNAKISELKMAHVEAWKKNDERIETLEQRKLDTTYANLIDERLDKLDNKIVNLYDMIGTNQKWITTLETQLKTHRHRHTHEEI